MHMHCVQRSPSESHILVSFANPLQQWLHDNCIIMHHPANLCGVRLPVDSYVIFL